MSYNPIDVTPEELKSYPLPDWAIDPIDPREINWQSRIKEAIVPFYIVEGMPLNPMGFTGKIGRNLPKWGENQAADPVVKASGKILLIQRDDCGEWAIPGGMVNPGEFAKKALVRELKEETGVDLSTFTPKVIAQTYIDDPRNTDNAWITSTVAVFELEFTVQEQADDDAMDAGWFDFSSMDALEADLQEKKQGKLYEAHRPILSLVLTDTEV